MVNIDASAIANAEAVDWVVLDVNVMDRARSEDFAELDEVIWPANVVSNH